MAKPWFKFWPANFVEATYAWKPSVVGIYMRLLLFQFSHGAIPSDVGELLEISGCTLDEWNSAWQKLCKKFETTDDGSGYLNPKMDVSRSDADTSYHRRVKAAEKSHESRRKKATNDAKQLQSTCIAHASASGSGSGSEINSIFAHYQTYHPRAKLGDNHKLISKRLAEGFSLSDCIKAIDGCHKSQFHCGENDGKRKYQSLGLIFRSADKLNEFVELSEKAAETVDTIESLYGEPSQ